MNRSTFATSVRRRLGAMLAAGIPLGIVLGLAPTPAAAQSPAPIVDTAHVTDAAAAIPGVTVVDRTPAPGASTPAALMGATPMPNWPIRVPRVTSPFNFGPSRGLVLADLDADGKLDVIASSTDSKIYAWDHTGTPLPGWPVTVQLMPQYAPSVGDVDGDGDLEVVQATRGLTNGGQVYVFNHDGTTLPGWPKSVGSNGNYVTASITLVDLDHDGKLELICGERDYPVTKLWVFRHDGSVYPGAWPVTLDHVPTGSATVGDIDDDGDLEIVYLSYYSIWAFERDGTVMQGWPYDVNTNHNARFSYQSAALTDLTGDGKLEIVTACHWQGPGCYIFRHDGTLLPGWPKSWGSGWTYSPPTVADLDNDGKPEILCGRASNGLYCWDVNGNPRPGFPFQSGASTEGPIIVANIDADPELEILCDSNQMDSASLGWIYAVDHRGNVESGWPIRPQGISYMNGCSVADVDGDGVMEVAQISYNPSTPDSYVCLWKIGGSAYQPSEVDWATYHENDRRTGMRGEGFRLTGSGSTQIGQSYTLAVKGMPGNGVYLAGGVVHANAQVPPFGVFKLNPLALFLLTAGQVPVGGTYAFTVPIPNVPALRGIRVFFQALEGANLGGGDGAFTDVVSIVLR